MIENADRNRFASMLKGKTVVIGVTASISIYRVPDLIRDLRREGAQVHVGMSREAAEMVSPEIMKWASGNEVVTGITGDIEHISLFRGEPSDTVLAIVPSTHNTIGKVANGISDDVPSAFFSFAIGNGNRIVLAPAMHEGMYRNPANARNVEFLRDEGVDIVPPELSEEKAKLSGNDEIVDHICRAFYGVSLRGRKIMIIGGHTEEPIDQVRAVTNHGTGFTAYWLSRMAFRLGADMISYVGNCTVELPTYIRFTAAMTSTEIENAALGELKNGYDAILSPAAISDFTVRERIEGKASGSEGLRVELEPRGKIIGSIRKSYRGILVTFNLTERQDPGKIREKFKSTLPELIVSNSFAGRSPFGSTLNSYMLLTPEGEEKIDDVSKPEVSINILMRVAGIMEGKVDSR